MIEGSWDDVLRLIGRAHTLVHQGGVLRVQTDIRVGTRCVSDIFQNVKANDSIAEAKLLGIIN